MSTPQPPVPYGQAPQWPYPMQPMVSPKNPLLHAVVSFFFPGVGSMMAGRVVAGLMFLLGIWVVAPIIIVIVWWSGISIAVTGSESAGETSIGASFIVMILLIIAAFCAWIMSIWHAHHAAAAWNRARGIAS